MTFRKKIKLNSGHIFLLWLLAFIGCIFLMSLNVDHPVETADIVELSERSPCVREAFESRLKSQVVTKDYARSVVKSCENGELRVRMDQIKALEHSASVSR